MNYYVADLHLYDDRIIKMCNRPFVSMPSMLNKITENWNVKVTATDVVYILGDLATDSISSSIEFIKNLNGKKVLVYGNHDEKFLEQYERSCCFEKITSLLTIEDEGRDVTLCHYPLLSFKESTRNGYHICGHIHNNEAEANRDLIESMHNVFNAGVDVTYFQICSLKELINYKNIQWILNMRLSADEQQKINEWVKIIGKERYQLIYDLASQEGHREIGYYELTETAKYEARLASILFQSVKYIESAICVKLLERKPKYDVHKKTFNNIINDYLQFKGNKDKILNTNLHAIRKLRNMVCHNNFLFDDKKMPCCNIGNEQKCDLKSNILNFIRYLPDAAMKRRRKKSINEICSYFIKETGKQKQLPNDIAIIIEDNEVDYANYNF